jgi:hypothetical protein
MGLQLAPTAPGLSSYCSEACYRLQTCHCTLINRPTGMPDAAGTAMLLRLASIVVSYLQVE